MQLCAAILLRTCSLYISYIYIHNVVMCIALSIYYCLCVMDNILHLVIDSRRNALLYNALNSIPRGQDPSPCRVLWMHAFYLELRPRDLSTGQCKGHVPSPDFYHLCMPNDISRPVLPRCLKQAWHAKTETTISVGNSDQVSRVLYICLN